MHFYIFVVFLKIKSLSCLTGFCSNPKFDFFSGIIAVGVGDAACSIVGTKAYIVALKIICLLRDFF